MKNQFIVGNTFELIKQFPDNYFDVIIADPMYDLNQNQKYFLHKEFLRVSRGAIIVFMPPENQWVFDNIEEYHFWIKETSTKNVKKRASRFVEMMFFYNRHARNLDMNWSNYTNIHTDKVDYSKIHPFRKPLSLIERLVRIYTNFGDLILDPFAGSAVVADACTRSGRACFSLDKTDKYIKSKVHTNFN